MVILNPKGASVATDDSPNTLKNQIAELKAELVRAVLFEMNRAGQLDSDPALVREISVQLDAAVARSIEQNLSAEDGPLVELNRAITAYGKDWAALLKHVGQGIEEAETRIRDLHKQVGTVSIDQPAKHLDSIERALTQIDGYVTRLSDRLAALEAEKAEESLRNPPEPSPVPAPIPSPPPSSPAPPQPPIGTPEHPTSPPPGVPTGSPTAVPFGDSRFKIWVRRRRDWFGRRWNSWIAGFAAALIAVGLYLLGPALWRGITQGGAETSNAAEAVPPPPAQPQLPTFQTLSSSLREFLEVTAATPNDQGTISDVALLAPPPLQLLRAGVGRVRAEIDAAMSKLTSESAVEAARRLNRERQRQALLQRLQEAGADFSGLDLLLTGNPATRPARERSVQLSRLNGHAEHLLAAVAAFEATRRAPDPGVQTNASNGSADG